VCLLLVYLICVLSYVNVIGLRFKRYNLKIFVIVAGIRLSVRDDYKWDVRSFV
jgi:hypothetical protein